MSIKKAKAIWRGNLKEGYGETTFGDFKGTFTFSSRFEKGRGTNPEELVGAALASCYSMFLSALITEEGFNPQSIETHATVNLEEDNIGPNITNIILICNVRCEGLSKEKFIELTIISKDKCPISRLYAGGTAEIGLIANLVE